MPDRVLGKHPRFASYLILAMALVIFGLSIWVYTLSDRVGNGEADRRAEKVAKVEAGKVEARADAKRSKLGLRFAQTLVDVSICIPLANVQDILDSGTLTPMEREDREAAKNRYLEKLAELLTLSPALKDCDK